MGQSEQRLCSDCVLQTGKVWTGVLVETIAPIYRKDKRKKKNSIKKERKKIKK